ncbi:hypothetical protein [Xanthomonas translucens]|uniref:hypothetical protein n=4 Tax=Xanthomonas campestris pv. translucens TaxID=343 RepID=UPI001E40D0E9|nr:hypothetical protein [Xanthomonas translucens]MCT8281381.1 hypothetical protein [Xanthomonas translucens pv. undulosa]MCT8316082.1 hypothetical protein [Xanthomonas translucens pv. undulosa]WLA05638.1 hypothetical protein MO329_04820 [Xanthomonas translucens]WLA15232.1 hypothetical protein MO326_14945 [Xanthomonas translucens]
MTAARRTTKSMTTAAATPLHSANGAHADAPGRGAKAPAKALRARGAPGTRSEVFQSPLSAGGTDSDLRRRAQRTRLATRVAAVGTIAAVAAVAALIAWRRARR